MSVRYSYEARQASLHHPLQWTAAGALGPAMNGQVYFGDPYQYKQYLELRHAVNPFPGLPACFPRRDNAVQGEQYRSPYNNYNPVLTTRPSTLALPSTLQPGVGVNPCLAANFPNRSHPAPNECSGTVPFLLHQQVEEGSLLPPPSQPSLTQPSLTQPSLTQPTLTQPTQQLPTTNSTMELTPPTSNHTPDFHFEDLPELLMPDVCDSTDPPADLAALADGFTGFFSETPTTPPSEMDDLLELDLSSGIEPPLASEDVLGLITPVSTPVKEEKPPPSDAAKLRHLTNDKIPFEGRGSVPVDAPEQKPVIEANTVKRENGFCLTEPLAFPANQVKVCKRKTGKRGRKHVTKSSKRTRESRERESLKDDHLLQKVLVDTFINGSSSEQKAHVDKLFDESLFLNSSVQDKQSCMPRHAGSRDYQHLVNSHHQNWGSSDVRVRIVSSSNPPSDHYKHPHRELHYQPDTRHDPYQPDTRHAPYRAQPRQPPYREQPDTGPNLFDSSSPDKLPALLDSSGDLLDDVSSDILSGLPGGDLLSGLLIDSASPTGIGLSEMGISSSELDSAQIFDTDQTEFDPSSLLFY